MPSGDMLGIGTSGLLAYQRVLSTIGHNISNVNTEGYSRQRVELDTNPPQGYGSGFLGSGVKVTTVERVYDEFLVGQVRTQTTRMSELDAYYDLASRIDNLLSDPEAGMTPMLQEFFNSAQAVADAPGSIPARQVMLTTAESLTERMHYMHDAVNSLNGSINLDITNTIDEINGLAASIAELNHQIVLQTQSYNQPPNDLLDQRDELLRQLSERIAVSTVKQDDGAINVFVGTGQNLVVGSRSSTLATTLNAYDATQLDIEIVTGAAGGGINITQSITGGKLGGLFAFKEEILDPTLNQLGRLAVGLSDAFNQQHSQGLTLNDVLGGEFFTDLTTTTAQASGDNDAATDYVFQVDVTDISQLTAKDYILEYDGANYRVLDYTSGTLVTGPAAMPITVDGLTISVASGTSIAANDRFLITPLRNAAWDMGVEVDDVSDIAAAGAVRAYESTSVANRGDATITAGEKITDTADPQYVTDAVFNTLGSFDVVFSASNPLNSPTVDQYTIYQGGAPVSGPTAYVPGVDTRIAYSGMEFTISGEPLDGDSFTMERNVGATSDNRNALELAALQSTPTLVNGGAGPTVDFQEAYGQLVSQVGTQTHQADVTGQAQQVLLQQAVAARDQISGVNLDEEAAQLIRFQQAYQATAKVITTAQTMFQTLLDAVR